MQNASLARSITAGKKLLIGVVHLGPLRGSPLFTDHKSVRSRALNDADAMLDAGLDGLIIENFGDVPFFRERVGPETVAEMALIASEIRRVNGSDFLMGINVLRNDAEAAIGIAAACDAQFIRVNVHTGVQFTDQGTIQGRAAETLRTRQRLGCSVEILADVAVKHATPPAGFDADTSARDTAYRGLADGLITTGRGTGQPADLEELRRVRAAVPDRPLFVGSGVDSSSVATTLRVADGVIIGTSLKEGGDVARPVSSLRVRKLVENAR